MEHVSCYQGGYGPCRDIDRSWEERVMFWLDFTHYADTSDCLFLPFFLFPTPKPMYDTDLVWNPCTIQSQGWPLYDIYLRATITTILSIRGVTIPIDLVSSTTDSIRRSIVLFKPVSLPTSDPKSEFLYQSSLHCAEPTDPWTTSYTWDISHTLVTTYHPYCHSPSALTEYLKQKLCHQQAKRLSCSLPTQVEQDVPLECNTTTVGCYDKDLQDWFYLFTRCTDTGVIVTHTLSFYRPLAPLFLLTHAQLAVVTQSCALLYTAAHCDLLLQWRYCSCDTYCLRYPIVLLQYIS